MRPTQEQQAIIDAYLAQQNLVIEAGAGAGKTSTLRLLANAAPRRRGIYVAYNRAIADDAKRTFPQNVTCATAHSFAFRTIGRQFAHRLRGPRMPARQIAKTLGVTQPVRIDPARILAPQQAARLVMDTVARFCHSAAPQITDRHVPKLPGLDDPTAVATLREVVVPLAGRAWEDLSDRDGSLRFTHDHYLKMWQLSGPRFPADFVLLDEAQDANPVVQDVVERQHHAQRILVGDRCQAIYGWRGAVDAMATFTADTRLALSQSFRFGPPIAAQANKWLQILDAPLRLQGSDQIASTISSLTRPDAVLCRTNAEAVSQLMAAAEQGQRAALVGGGGDIHRLAEAATTLKAGLGTDHPELFAFRTWGEVQDYVAQDASGSDLKTFVQLIDAYGPETVIDTMDRLVPEQAAQVVVSTAHKAKGREWPLVRIADDFHQPKDQDTPIPQAEAMLAYVAVTRARLALDPDGLAWVDRWLTTRPTPALEPALEPPSAPTREPATAGREVGNER